MEFADDSKCVVTLGLAPLWDGMRRGCLGLVLVVIRAPMLPMDRAARLIEIRDNSNFRALNPA